VARLTLTLSVPTGESWRLVEALRSLIPPTRQACGCLGCDVLVSTGSGDPSSIRYSEDWSTDADLRRHVGSDRFPRLLQVMEEALDPPRLEFELAGGPRGLDYVREVRGGGVHGSRCHGNLEDTHQ
jgi:quinol monooxygenase YgiN